MPISPDYRKVVELVDAALDLEIPLRDEYLSRECAGDSKLRAEVESLLAEENETARDVLEIPAALHLPRVMAEGNAEFSSAQEDTDDPSADLVEEALETIGPYSVLKVLGRGGMGTVYLAEQREPIERLIAVKVIHGQIDDAGSRRFADECRALARLKHPNIAAVYDAGVSEKNRAFVAMEWVEGSDIAEWCDDKRLSIQARIELFLGVCAGVGHAHSKGLVHRDLKPSNVLVAEVDGQATAKIIDFGIARSLDKAESSSSSDKTAALDGTDRNFSLPMGSPLYMSPEAVKLIDRSDVDTRSDVYSLGILLYEMLVGVPPLDFSELSLGALLRQARTIDRPAPTIRWAQLSSEKQARLASLRGLGAPALERKLRGDLDAILLKATAQNREDRYGTVSDFAKDLGRFLSSHPVEARTPSPAYHFSRFVRRNAGAVVAGLLLIGVLVGGVVARTLEARRANQEAEKARLSQVEAEKVSEFLIGLFRIEDPDRTRDEAQSVDDLLAKAEATMDEELADQPLARARFHRTIGLVALNRMDIEHAADSYEKTLALLEEHSTPDDPEIVTTLGSLGVIYRQLDRYDEAEASLARAIEILDTSPEPDLDRLSATLSWLANLRYQQRRFEEASTGHRRALEIRRQSTPRNEGAIAESLNNLGIALRELGRFTEATPILREAEVSFTRAFGTEHPMTVISWLNLAGVEEKLGNWQKAESYLQRAGDRWHEVHGPIHSRTLLARRGLGALWRRWHRTEEAVDHLSRLLEMQEAEGADYPREIARTLSELGKAHSRGGDFSQARLRLNQALEILTEIYGFDHVQSRRIRAELAVVSWKSGDLEGAAAELEDLLRFLEQENEEYGATNAILHRALGAIRLEQGRYPEADVALNQALEFDQIQFDGPSRDVAKDLYHLGRLRVLQGQRNAGAELLERALDIYDSVLPTGHPELEAARKEVQALARNPAAG